jgi:hypothetical protein
MRTRVRTAVGLAILSALLCSTVFIGIGCGEEGGGGDLAILNIDPRNGPLTGQNVKIVGTNFRTDIGYTVYFGNKQAESVTILNPETLALIAPQRDEAGEVDVTIRADDGAAFRIVKGFRYVDMAGAEKTKKGALPF